MFQGVEIDKSTNLEFQYSHRVIIVAAERLQKIKQRRAMATAAARRGSQV